MTGPKVTRLVTLNERITRSSAQQIEGAIAALPGLTSAERHSAMNALYRVSEPSHSRQGWGPYVMLSVQQIDTIWDAIRQLPKKDRPHDVRHVLDKALVHLRQDTGEIMLTRAELSEKTGITPQDVSKALGVLARLGVVIKGEYRRYPGQQGRGLATYFINPHAAWNGALAIRSIEAERQPTPMLRIMQGGKDQPPQ